MIFSAMRERGRRSILAALSSAASASVASVRQMRVRLSTLPSSDGLLQRLCRDVSVQFSHHVSIPLRGIESTTAAAMNRIGVVRNLTHNSATAPLTPENRVRSMVHDRPSSKPAPAGHSRLTYNSIPCMPGRVKDYFPGICA